MKEQFKLSFCEKLKYIHMELSDHQLEQFYVYYEMLIEWNKEVNLTAIVEMEDVILKHFIDSLSIVNTKLEWNGKSMIDVGTGAGFPGIPLKIVFPELNVVLLDSLNKRIKFLDAAIETLALKNITALHGRAEDYGRDKAYREKFDYCVSRAVAGLSSLSEYCLPFVKSGGYFVSYKSGNCEEEVLGAKNAVFRLAGKIQESITFKLPESDMERCLIMIKKVSPTSSKYPRKAGLPTKEPLC